MRSVYLWLLGTMLTGVLSCKKYGYRFEDGTDPGQPGATAVSSSKPLGNDFSKLDVARVFPGLVGAAEPRLSGETVTIRLDQKYVYPGDLRIVATPGQQYSTGLYAPAGEPVLIEVPEGVVGLKAQIGGWTDNLSGTQFPKRDPLIYSIALLSAGKNYIRNLYGGSIYILASQNTSVKEAVLKVSGAVRSPDFVLGESTDTEWAARMQQSSVPWVQLRGKRIIFELPKYFFDKHPVIRPTALMQEWDRIIDEDIYRWKGLEAVTADSLNKAPELPVWVIMDAQPRAAYAHAYQPVVLQMDEAFFANEIANLDQLTKKGAWRTLSEIGRNNVTATWVWSDILETMPNLYSIKMANRLGINIRELNPAMKLAVDTALWYVRQPKTVKSNFAADLSARTNGYLIKLMPFIQLLDKISSINPAVNGYDLMQYVDYRMRHLFRQTYSNPEKINLFYQYASEFAQTDLYPFFYYWSLLPSGPVVDSIGAKYPRLNKDIYNYNPVADTGGTRPVPVPSRILDRSGWLAIDFCCQEAERGFYASNLLDGNMEMPGIWLQRGALSPATRHALPHWFIFDMGKFNNVAGYWYAVDGTSVYYPRYTSCYLSATLLTNDSPDWIAADLNWSADAQKVSKTQILRNFPRVNNVRYIKFTINGNWGTNDNYQGVFSEFGMLAP
ncbi:MAG: M60 family metallopeptidase [Niabella sp.]|nr:M60 family metallopeptidase [Niabella sp.]